jgi:hypothetical protein
VAAENREEVMRQGNGFNESPFVGPGPAPYEIPMQRHGIWDGYANPADDIRAVLETPYIPKYEPEIPKELAEAIKEALEAIGMFERTPANIIRCCRDYEAWTRGCRKKTNRRKTMARRKRRGY